MTAAYTVFVKDILLVKAFSRHRHSFFTTFKFFYNITDYMLGIKIILYLHILYDVDRVVWCPARS